MIDFRMPTLGADMETGTLRAWRKRAGEAVKRGDIIAEVETQKGIIEIEVFDEGTIHELLLGVDEKVPVGSIMARILAPGEAAPPPGPRPPAIAPSYTTSRSKASPLARRLAVESGIDLATVRGSGPDGAITKEDVAHALAARSAPPPIPPGPGMPTRTSPSEGMRQAVAAAMSRSNREIPHYHLETAIDMTRALAWLKESNAKRSVRDRFLPAVLLIKAVALALRQVPELNAYWEHGPLPKESVHLGFVVSLRTGGIVVPAIHDADKKNLDEIRSALFNLIARARSFKLRSSELSDSTFTITSLGDQGVETVHGVIYPPQVGLVGFGAITERPWAVNGSLEVRSAITATLAADHRATDGSTGSRFLQAVKDHLQHPEAL